MTRTSPDGVWSGDNIFMNVTAPVRNHGHMMNINKLTTLLIALLLAPLSAPHEGRNISEVPSRRKGEM